MVKLAIALAACVTISLASSALSDQATLTGHDWKKLDQAKKEEMALQAVRLIRRSLNRQRAETAAEGIVTCMNTELSGDGWEQVADRKLSSLLAQCLLVTR